MQPRSTQPIPGLPDQQFPAGQRAMNTTSKTTSSVSNEMRRTLAMVWGVLLNRRLVSDPITSMAYRQFEFDMADLSEAELRKGVEAMKSFTGFFTFPTFREACRIQPSDLGLPDAAVAYREACCKALPWERQEWSHAAVYAAARETGRFELHSMTERDCLPMFERNYEIVMRRVMGGEVLDAPILKAIPETVTAPVSKSEGLRRIKGIRAMLEEGAA